MIEMNRKELIDQLGAQCIVIKVGSSLLTDHNAEDGFSSQTLEMLAQEIHNLMDSGKKVVLVSSGAVSTGRNLVSSKYKQKLNPTPNLSRKQALAAIGQAPLMGRYADLFWEHKIPVAQILITARDFQNRRSYLNIGHTLDELLKMGVLPIINENDTVATDELQFGENDLLSAAVAALLHAELLVILTSVDGFKIGDEVQRQITHINDEHRKAAGGPAGPGSGGMVTKLRAGELCSHSGILLAILPGFCATPISDFLSAQEIGTVIYKTPMKEKINAKKRWLLFLQAQGSLYLDEGATQALQKNGSSLLLAGVESLSGDFYAGDVVDIFSSTKSLIGRGVCTLGSSDLSQKLGNRQNTKSNTELYGELIIHRDNLVLEASRS